MLLPGRQLSKEDENLVLCIIVSRIMLINNILISSLHILPLLYYLLLWLYMGGVGVSYYVARIVTGVKGD